MAGSSRDKKKKSSRAWDRVIWVLSLPTSEGMARHHRLQIFNEKLSRARTEPWRPEDGVKL